MKSFSVIAGFYRRFIKGFSQTSRPLYDLTKKGRKWNWSPEAATAFAALKEALTTASVLRYPDFSLPMELHVDACDMGGEAWTTRSIQ